MLHVYGIVDQGNTKANNDDRALVEEYVYKSGYFELKKENLMLAAVADGVGGGNAGNVAAEETLKVMSGFYSKQGFNHPVDTIQRLVNEAYDRLEDMVNFNSDYYGMATTLTGVVIQDTVIITFNLGNSRVYRYRGGLLRQLTEDDSVVQMLIDTGMLEIGKDKVAKNKNIITKYVGSNGRRFDVSIKKQKLDYQLEDILLLMSDGVHDYITEEKIEDILRRERDLKRAIEQIMASIYAYEENDNITLIMIKKETGDER